MKEINEILLTLFGILMFTASSFGGDIGVKKVLFIDSYHEGYAWSDGVVNGVRDVLKDTAVELRIFRMDTKRNYSEDFKRQAALKAKALIESYQPDVLIASDDNASKYLIQPYYKNADLPIVFCGVNWDASVYGYPYTNATGMVEVGLNKAIVVQMRQFAKGDKIGLLNIDSFTAKKNAQHHVKFMGKPYDKTYYVHTYQEWKESFMRLQDEVDMMIMGNPHGILDWDEKDFILFAERHTRIPTGADIDWVKKFTLLGYLKLPEEQGSWAATTALRILKGEKPGDIPITQNKHGKLFLNIRLVKKLGIFIEKAIRRRAEIVQ
jgi:ABC-type uncharacterized transport system substrate-binding protein